MDIYHAEHIAISPFRAISLHTQTIFKPDYQGIFFYMIQLPLFIRQELNVSDSHCNFCALSFMTHVLEPRYTYTVFCGCM